MFGKLISKRNDADETGPEQIWAVGDIHGCADLLAKLISYLKAVQRGDPILSIVFLGDYVDRGPDSRAVIDMLLALEQDPTVSAQFIRGNHDDMLLAFLSDGRVGPNWHRFGGNATLAAYGVAEPTRVTDLDVWGQIQLELAAAIPPEHLDFLRRSIPSVTWRGYFLCHAGARPGRSLAKQTPEDMMWIRDAFLGDQRRFERIVVHGHTPAPEPFADARRIGVDTGAYATGVLTAVLLDGDEPLFVQAQRNPARPAEIRILASSNDADRHLG